MIRWLEHQGYDVTYITSVDTHEDVGRLTRGKAFLSVGHDEYWSEEMRSRTTAAARDHGTSLGFFSGNYMYWPVTLLPASDGSPNRTIALVDPTKTCDFACMGESEQSLAGGMWDDGHLGNGDIVVRSDALLDHWVFANSGLKIGDVIPGLIGSSTMLSVRILLRLTVCKFCFRHRRLTSGTRPPEAASLSLLTLTVRILTDGTMPAARSITPATATRFLLLVCVLLPVFAATPTLRHRASRPIGQ